MAELASTRLAFGHALVELGRTNPDVVALSADVSNSDHSYLFAEAYPDRFINVGIAEQALVDVAVGLAYCGKIPFANTFAFLFATRALEMIRTHLCYGRANVKLMAAYCGLSPSFEGPTHHAISDIATIRSLPNIALVAPADPISLTKLLPQVAEWPGPVYFRMNRNDVPLVYDESHRPQIGTAVTVREGSDVTLMGNGLMVSRCLRAAEMLDQERVSARVIDVHTIKPIDIGSIVTAARETGAIVTVEEHNIHGGLGGAVAEVLSETHPVPMARVGIRDSFAESGPYFEMLDKYGLRAEDVLVAVRRVLARKE